MTFDVAEIFSMTNTALPLSAHWTSNSDITGKRYARASKPLSYRQRKRYYISISSPSLSPSPTPSPSICLSPPSLSLSLLSLSLSLSLYIYIYIYIYIHYVKLPYAMTSSLNGCRLAFLFSERLSFGLFDFIQCILKLIVTRRLCAIDVREDREKIMTPFYTMWLYGIYKPWYPRNINHWLTYFANHNKHNDHGTQQQSLSLCMIWTPK